MDRSAYRSGSDWVHAVPEHLVEQARRLESGELQPVKPRHASTVVLLRDGPPLEVYVLRRRTTMAFAAGLYAFPGGSVDARDADLDIAWAGPTPQVWADRLGFSDPRLARASVCAAVRETFEECGVLLAGASEDSVVADTTDASWEADRMALLGRELSFAELLRRRGLVLRSDLLAAWDHWVTPRVESRRFDTRFFLAALPSGQRTRDVSSEADRVGWVTPANALAAVERGEMRMLPPTYHTLAELAKLTTVKDALTRATERTIRPIMPVIKPVESSGGEGARWVVTDPECADAGWSSEYDEGALL
ncbi:MAG TPA: NUDIX hydrolase [Actinopolymorphaceae bacterium]